MHIWSILREARSRFPTHTAVRQGEWSLNYAQFFERCQALAANFRAQGYQPSDRIAILAPNGPAFLEAYFATAGADLVLCPLNTRLHALELAHILRDCQARGWIVANDFADVARATLEHAPMLEDVLWTGGAVKLEIPGRTLRSQSWVEALAQTGERGFDPDSGDSGLAHLYYTSGTTGEPKGVMLTHGNVSVHATSAVSELRLDEGDVWGHFAPMFHLADAWASFAITLVGGTHVFAPRFEEPLVLDVFEQERVTLTNLVPTMLQRLVRFPGVEQRDFSSLRLILSGGAPIAPDVVREIMRVFRCTYVQTYGMTETSPYLTLSLLHPHLEKLSPAEQFRYRAKTGRSFRGVALRVVAEDGSDVASDGIQVGEIWARGPTVTPGYWQRPDLTAAAFSDGWLRTGDLATLDSEGYLDIVDRKKDMIISGGEKIYSTEVEHALMAHPGVMEAAVFGVPSAEWGEQVRAAVALRPGATVDASELLAHCRSMLAGYKCPKQIALLPELPKTGTGKIAKAKLRDAARGAAAHHS